MLANPIFPLGIAVVLYVWVAYGYQQRGALGTAFAWLCYALANGGFIAAILLKEVK